MKKSGFGKKILITLGIVLLVAGLAMAFNSYYYMENVRKESYIQAPYHSDNKMWEHIFSVDEPLVFDDGPLGVILPHHMIDSLELASFYDGLSSKINPSVVVVIGPNHFEAGLNPIQTCKKCTFSTFDGPLNLDDLLVESLIASKIATSEDETFLEEHSIFTHASYIKHYFAEANILPIVLKWETDPTDNVKLVEWLDENLPADALVIASVDFSHYQPVEVADFHDLSSYTTINNFDYENLYDLEVDSPASIRAILNFVQKRGALDASQVLHTNSQQFSKEHIEETTSHQFWSFSKGEIDPVKSMSILSFGNIEEEPSYEGQSLGFYTSWQWDSAYDSVSDLSIFKMLQEIRGTEDRFFVGSDFYVFDLLNDECSHESRNGMEVSFCKFAENSEVEDINSILKEESENVDLLYLLYEFDGSEFDDSYKSRVKEFADNGVDIFVGRGLSEVVPFEVYKGSLLFYSLGDFIGNSRLALELNSESEGVVLGLYVTDTAYYIYTFSVDVINGYPSLKDFSQRPDFFRSFTTEAGLSDSTEMDLNKSFVKIER